MQELIKLWTSLLETHSDGVKAGGYYFGNAPAPEVVIPTQAEEPEDAGLDQPIDQRPPLIAEEPVPVAGEESGVEDDFEPEPEEDIYAHEDAYEEAN